MNTKGHLEIVNIIRLGNGWYDFKNIPQGYVKVHGLNCGSDEKALRQAVKLNPSFDFDYQIIDAQ